MARQRSYRRSHSRSRKRARTQHGGDLAGNPASSWGWGLGTVGNGWTQFMNALTLQPGANAGSIGSNDLVPIGKMNANDPGVSLLNQKGGKRRRSGKSKKGGFLGIGALLEQAIVPFGLLGMQQSYGKSRRTKYSGSKRTRRNR